MNGISFDTKVFKTTYAALETKLELNAQQGGTFSGKTYNVLLAHCMYYYNNKNLNHTISIVAQTFPQIRRGVWKDWNNIHERIPHLLTRSKDSTYEYWIGNNRFEFFSASDDPNKVRAGKRDVLIIDECDLLDWETADLLIGKTTVTTSLTWNPYSDFWFHDELIPTINKHNYVYKITTFKDNPKISEKTIRWLEAMRIKDPEKYRILGEGKTGNGVGLVFPNVKYVNALPSVPKYVYGLDIGYTNDPTVLVKTCLYHGELYGKQIFYEYDYKKRQIIDEFISAGIDEYDLIVMDKDHTLYGELLEAGFNVIMANKPKVEESVRAVKEYPINIHIDSIDWRKEQKTYKYKIKDGKPTRDIVDQNNHAWDAFRYSTQPLINPGMVSRRPVKKVRILTKN